MATYDYKVAVGEDKMNKHKRVFLGAFVLVLLAIIIIINGVNNMRPEKALADFSKIIEREDIDDISLTIYYMKPYILTSFALSVDDLVNRQHEHRIVVGCSELRDNFDLLKQIGSIDLLPYKHEKSYLDARIYYVFKKGNSKIFDVTMWGGWDEASIFINGDEFYMNDVFVDIIIPYLPEYAARNLEEFKENEGKF